VPGTSAARVGREPMASPARRRSLLVPREHGAWGILLVPLVTGAFAGLRAGGEGWSLAPLVLTALSLFWLRTPVESWMGTTPVHARSADETRLVRKAVFLLAAVAAASATWLFWGGRNRGLLWIGAMAAAAFAAQAVLKRSRRHARTAAQMIGAAGLTSTAPAAYYTVTGSLTGPAWSFWAANLLFAVNQIHYVQVRIRAAHAGSRREKLSIGRRFLAGQIFLLSLLVSACDLHWFRWYVAAAFAPILIRGFWWLLAPPRLLAVHRLGKSELGFACLFGLLLVLGFALG